MPVVMLLYSMFYGATIPLVNSLMFTHIKGTDIQAPTIFLWAPVAWALVGYMLSGWRMTRKSEGDGSDCLVFAAILSLVFVNIEGSEIIVLIRLGGSGGPPLNTRGGRGGIVSSPNMSCCKSFDNTIGYGGYFILPSFVNELDPTALFNYVTRSGWTFRNDGMVVDV